jgi:hypothetical protein
VAALCVIVCTCPAIVIVAVRELDDWFADTEYVTVLEPGPDPLTVTHEALADADHGHDVPVVSVSVAEPAVGAIVRLAGVSA